MVYADVFRARQLYDKLCARHLGVGAKRLGAHHRRRARFAQHRCALRVARGRGARLAAHSADERQLRRAVLHQHSREDAGPRLRRAQFAAILILQRGALSC